MIGEWLRRVGRRARGAAGPSPAAAATLPVAVERGDHDTRMRMALEAARAGWWSRDENDVITAPPETFELCGLPWSDTLTIAAWAQNVVPEDRAGLVKAVAESRINTTSITRFLFRIDHPRDGRRWMHLVSSPVLDGQGRQIGAQGLLTDETDRVRLEQQLREARDAAERASAAKTRMLAAASHDLRQPLQGMFLFLGALEKAKDAARRERAVGQLRVGMEALKFLLDTLAETARVEGGAIRPVVAPFRLERLLGELAGEYRPRAEEKGLELALVAVPTVVSGDRELVARMLRNLLENALRYTHQGGITIRARLECGNAMVEVVDTGIGIAAEHLDAIWEEFHQVGNPERDRTQGLGLGLSIVRALARTMGNPVAVTSRPGEGSSFTVRLPVTDEPVREEPPPEAPPADAADPASAALGPVVVIDDDPLVLSGLRSVLAAGGYATIGAASGPEAVAAVRRARRTPCFVLADYRLPMGERGTHAVAEVRAAANAPVPALILTGEVGDEVAQDAAEHGVDLVRKPLHPGDILARIGRAVNDP